MAFYHSISKKTGVRSALIKNVRFGILSPEEIRRQSVIPEGIVHAVTAEEGKAKEGGLTDPRQGPVDARSTCVTCGMGQSKCPGHWAHVELVEPVFNVIFFPQILKVLRCVCIYCSRLKLAEDDPKVQAIVKKSAGKVRLARIHALCKDVKCCQDASMDADDPTITSGGCGRPLPRITRSGLALFTNKNSESASPLSAKEALQILQNMTDGDVAVLGMNPKLTRPEWMICTAFPAPPLAVRPSVMSVGSSKRSQDDLTHKLGDIVAANQELASVKQAGAPSAIVQDLVTRLQLHCATFANNEMPGVPRSVHKGGRELKTLKKRLTGKEGRIRGNLMGKRVDFCARTVITADPNLAIHEVGIPKSMASDLTVPETVTAFNVQRLQDIVARGGARCVIKGDAGRVDLRFGNARERLQLQPGWTVERHLEDGDVVVFNRQPSLHKMSMMGHVVRVMPAGSTFRLNLSVTAPYNADFDGDEMNLHVPQSLEARAEVEQLCLVPKQIITPQSNGPVMGIVQDTLTALSKLTRRDVFLEKSDMMTLCLFLPTWDGRLPRPAVLKPLALWTGKQLFSLVLPKGGLNLSRTFSAHPDGEDEGPYRWITPGDTRVLIQKGELLSGIVCKKTVGASAGSLMHVVFAELGSETAAGLYGHLQTVVNHWLQTTGLTMGIEDTIPDPEACRDIRDTVDKTYANVDTLIQEFKEGRLELLPGNSAEQSLESRVNRELNEARDRAGSCTQKTLRDSNNLKAMVMSGAKGSKINISQVMALVGQQSVEGKRIPFGFKDRTLPHFPKHDLTPESRGFVRNSYLTGLQPAEFFFHAMGGREGIIDTAIKTAETGYIQRRIVKAMETNKVAYDGTVRDCSGRVVQFQYGEDGLDGAAVEFQNLPTLCLSDKDFLAGYRFQTSANLGKLYAIDIVSDLLTDDTFVQELEDEWKTLQQDRETLRQIFPTGDSRVALPCNLQRMVWTARTEFPSKKSLSDLSPLTVVRGVRELVNGLKAVPGSDNDPITAEANASATLLFSTLVRATLCAWNVRKLGLSKEGFEWVLREIHSRYHQALAHPGEMVGVLAAQCLGEPATQMTLNTFHYAGVSAKNVTLGVPRLQEILNLTATPKTPSMTIHLTGPAATDPELAKHVLCRLEHTTLGHVALASTLHFDPDPAHTVVPEDRTWIENYYLLPDIAPELLNPWVLRIQLDDKAMADKRLTMDMIANKIQDEYNGVLSVIYNDDNSENLVMRIRNLKNQDDESMDGNELLKCLEQELMDKLTLKGIKKITKVYMSKPTAASRKRTFIDKEGQFEKVSEWVLETDGSNLLEVLSDPEVDCKRTFTNDLQETFSVFGIEGIRKAIEREIHQVISFDSSYVNHRHLALLCDVMTARGSPMPVTRHGVSQQDLGPLSKCTFEQSIDVLAEAATVAECDTLKGVSDNIMLGNLTKVGTGAFDVLLDVDKCALGVSQESLAKNSYKSGLGNHSFQGDNLSFKTAHPSKLANSNIAATSIPSQAFLGYSSTDPSYSPASPGYSITSPAYKPKSPSYSPVSPSYNPTSPSYSPVSPGYNPTSPSYSPVSPGYNPTSPSYNPTTPSYSPVSPSYSPTSPSYHPTFNR